MSETHYKDGKPVGVSTHYYEGGNPNLKRGTIRIIEEWIYGWSKLPHCTRKRKD